MSLEYKPLVVCDTNNCNHLAIFHVKLDDKDNNTCAFCNEGYPVK